MSKVEPEREDAHGSWVGSVTGSVTGGLASLASGALNPGEAYAKLSRLGRGESGLDTDNQW